MLTLSPEQGISNERHELVMETDSLRIVYNFYQRPMRITVENLGSTPIAIDWQRSSFITNGNAHAYANPMFTINGAVRTDSAFRLIGSRVFNSDISGTAVSENAVDLIPPHSRIAKKFEVVPVKKLRNVSDEGAEPATMNTEPFPYRYSLKRFSAAETPLKLRSYIVGTRDGQPVYIDHSFFVSEIWFTKRPEDQLPAGEQNHGNRVIL